MKQIFYGSEIKTNTLQKVPYSCVCVCVCVCVLFGKSNLETAHHVSCYLDKQDFSLFCQVVELVQYVHRFLQQF